MEEEYDATFPSRPFSYLQARDPSILSWRRYRIENVRQNLASDFSSVPSVSSEKQDEGLNVHLRIKGSVPLNGLYTIEDNTLVCAIPGGSFAGRSQKQTTTVLKKYEFTTIFGPDATQEELFHTVIKGKVLNFINGSNSTLLAYGASGSGKTFTMIGTAEKPGIIPRFLDYLFRTLSEQASHFPKLKPLSNGKIDMLDEYSRSQEIAKLRSILGDPQTYCERAQHVKTYSEMEQRLSTTQVGIVNAFPSIINVYVSFAEIYNEHIYDLLGPLQGRRDQRPKLKIGGLQDNIYIRGLKYVYVRSGLDAFQVLQYGLHNLSYASTAINQHSSRSHCIFSIRLIAGNDEKNCNLSVFNFCDLAGSERLKKTLNEGDRLKESLKINTSLSVLGRCISSIRDMQQNIKYGNCNAPFRESKLTQLFQKSLQGKEDIVMIVNMNPSLNMLDDTQHTLMFSAIAKQIVIQEAPEKILKPNRVSAYHQHLSLYLGEEDKRVEITELRNQRAELVLELSELKERIDFGVELERNHLRKNFSAIIEIKDSQITELQQEVDELKFAKECLEKEKRQLRRELIERQEVVIILSSDDSDSEEESSDERRKFCNEEHSKNEIENLKKLQQDIETLRSNKRELEITVEDANLDFSKLRRKYEESRVEVAEITTKNLVLEDELFVKNAELEDLRIRTMAQSEEIERLEDQYQESLLSIKSCERIVLSEEIEKTDVQNQEVLCRTTNCEKELEETEKQDTRYDQLQKQENEELELLPEQTLGTCNEAGFMHTSLVYFSI